MVFAGVRAVLIAGAMVISGVASDLLEDTVIPGERALSHGPLRLSDARYDVWFLRYTRTYIPEVRWTLLKSQCFQESRLDPLAVSPADAKGLCQFLETTWETQARKAALDRANIFDPQHSIHLAARYMRYLRGEWTSPRPEEDRHSLALASYNAGLGNLLGAQERCNGDLLYSEIISCLPEITGHHSEETITYVKSVWRWDREIRLGLRG